MSDEKILDIILPFAKYENSLKDVTFNAEVRLLEYDAINLAEHTQYEKAIEKINMAIKQSPINPSLYNNRAQINQLQHKITEALQDLNIAVQLVGNECSSIASQIYCQRGVIHQSLKDIDKAKMDFEKSAQLGNAFAQSQLTQMNPYSALCNHMLQQLYIKTHFTNTS